MDSSTQKTTMSVFCTLYAVQFCMYTCISEFSLHFYMYLHFPLQYKMESLPFPLQRRWRAANSQLWATSDVGLLLNFLTIALCKIPFVETQILVKWFWVILRTVFPSLDTKKDLLSHLSAELPLSTLCSVSSPCSTLLLLLLLLLLTAQLLSDCCSPAPEQLGATPNSRALKS